MGYVNVYSYVIAAVRCLITIINKKNTVRRTGASSKVKIIVSAAALRAVFFLCPTSPYPTTHIHKGKVKVTIQRFPVFVFASFGKRSRSMW